MGFARRRRSTGCAASGARRAWPRGKGSRRSACSTRWPSGAIKALWVIAHQPGRQPAGRGPGARGAARPRPARRLRGDGRHRHRRRRPRAACASCPPRPGARRTAPSPTPSAASRASAPSCRRRARRGRTGGWSAEVARRMGFGDAFAYAGPADDLPRARGALRLRERRRAPLRPRRPRRAHRRGLRRAGARPVAGARRGDGRPARLFAEGGFSTPTAAPASSPSRRPTRSSRDAEYPVPPQHRPRPRPLAHHDPDRPLAPPRPPHARALRRHPSGRRGGAGLERRRPRRGPHGGAARS